MIPFSVTHPLDDGPQNVSYENTFLTASQLPYQPYVDPQWDKDTITLFRVLSDKLAAEALRCNTLTYDIVKLHDELKKANRLIEDLRTAIEDERTRRCK